MLLNEGITEKDSIEVLSFPALLRLINTYESQAYELDCITQQALFEKGNVLIIYDRAIAYKCSDCSNYTYNYSECA